MHHIIIFVILLFAFYLPAKSSLKLVEQAQAQLNQGNYNQAIKLLEKINIKIDLENSQHMQQALEIKVIAYAKLKKTNSARQAMHELYFINPDFKFDQFATPKKILRIAQEVKISIDKKNRHFEATKKNILTKKKITPKIETKIIEKEIYLESPPSKLTAFMPFGTNHFLLKQPINGSIYLSLQSISLVTNILSYWWKNSYLTNSKHLKIENSHMEKKFYNIQTIQFISLGALAVSYSVSVIHALIDHSRWLKQKI